MVAVDKVSSQKAEDVSRSEEEQGREFIGSHSCGHWKPPPLPPRMFGEGERSRPVFRPKRWISGSREWTRGRQRGGVRRWRSPGSLSRVRRRRRRLGLLEAQRAPVPRARRDASCGPAGVRRRGPKGTSRSVVAGSGLFCPSLQISRI